MNKLRIRIVRKYSTDIDGNHAYRWYWELSDLGNNFIVCRSCNFTDINNPGNYSTKSTAISSAKRFICNYLGKMIGEDTLVLEDHNGNVLEMYDRKGK